MSSKTRSCDVVVVGDINVDLLALVDQYPAPGGHSLARELHAESGGSAANAARLLGILGLHVVMLGRVGSDPLAEWALRGLRAAAVDVSRVRQDAGAATGFFFVAVTPDGERTMFGGRGANGRLSPDDIDTAAIERSCWLHLSGYPLQTGSGRAALQKAAAAARRAGVPVGLDVGYGPATSEWRAPVLELAATVDVLLPNEREAALLTGEDRPAQAAARLVALGVPRVVVKLGERGCYVATGSERWAVPAFDVRAVDSTGAGDAFGAGFIAAQLAGFDLRTSALLANALGGLAATVVGAGGTALGPARLLRFLDEHRGDGHWVEWADEIDIIAAWLARLLRDRESGGQRDRGSRK